MKRLEDGYVECGLCEARVEGILSNNIVLIGGCDEVESLLIPLYMLVSLYPWLVIYGLYIILCTLY